ncbi:MAG: carbohydrate binding domain-containing protein [Spirochaetales bacterium]|nr:carbohydrate binding domain-containing protein [Spirochaetales bacterium]
MKRIGIFMIIAAAALVFACATTSGGAAGGSPAAGALYTTDFESGIGDWAPYGGSPTIEVSTDFAHSGTQSLKTADREQTWNAPALDITGLTFNAGAYAVTCWVLVPKDSPVSAVKMTVETMVEGAKNWVQIAKPVEAEAEKWVQITGTFVRQKGLESARLYVEPLDPEGTFYVDDVSIAPAPEEK